MSSNFMLALTLACSGTFLVMLGNMLDNDKLIGIGGACILFTCAVAL